MVNRSGSGGRESAAHSGRSLQDLVGQSVRLVEILRRQQRRRALGDEATQAGSQNDAGRFRFDFASPAAVPDSVLSDIEAEVNDVLLADMAVRAFVTTQEEAKRIGALAMFGEKYGDAVRVVEVGEYSRELCGGTHAVHSAQLGLVKLLSEASIGSGKRRIEGLVGADAYTYLAREHLLVSQLTDLLKATPDELVDRVGLAISRVRELEKDLDRAASNGGSPRPFADHPPAAVFSGRRPERPAPDAGSAAAT